MELNDRPGSQVLVDPNGNYVDVSTFDLWDDDLCVTPEKGNAYSGYAFYMIEYRAFLHIWNELPPDWLVTKTNPNIKTNN